MSQCVCIKKTLRVAGKTTSCRDNCCRGPRGCPGPQGPVGLDGLEGPEGPDGMKGVTGPTGLAGGPTGPTGPTGPQGPRGFDGQDGPEGQQGIKGVTGPQGMKGPIGPEGGPIGPQGPRGFDGQDGQDGQQGMKGVTGPQGMKGPVGPTGPQGPVGPQGQAGSTGSNTLIFLTTDQSTSNNDFFGLGNASNNFFRACVVLPSAGKLTKMVFTTHGEEPEGNSVATVWRLPNGDTSPIATSLSVSLVNDGDHCALNTGSVDLQACDCIAVKLTRGMGAYADGVAATLEFKF